MSGINYARDSQRRKVYDAENIVFARKAKAAADDPPPMPASGDPLWMMTANEMLPEVKDILRYVKWIVRLKRVQAIVVPADPQADTRGSSRGKKWVLADVERLKDLASKLVITSQSRAACAWSWENRMGFSRGSRKKWIVIHELAHILCPHYVQHHWQFCYVYLLLVRYALGKEAERALKQGFRAGKVRFSPPRKKRILTDAERSILRDRLKIARSLRKTKPS